MNDKYIYQTYHNNGQHFWNGNQGQNEETRIRSLIKEEIQQMIPQIIRIVTEQNQRTQNSQINQVVHHNIICDGCEMKPIVGVRYHCTVKDDFDYCEKCEETKGHPYPFLKIRRPEQAPRSIKCIMNNQRGFSNEFRERPEQSQRNFFKNFLGNLNEHRGCSQKQSAERTGCYQENNNERRSCQQENNREQRGYAQENRQSNSQNEEDFFKTFLGGLGGGCCGGFGQSGLFQNIFNIPGMSQNSNQVNFTEKIKEFVEKYQNDKETQLKIREKVDKFLQISQMEEAQKEQIKKVIKFYSSMFINDNELKNKVDKIIDELIQNKESENGQKNDTDEEKIFQENDQNNDKEVQNLLFKEGIQNKAKSLKEMFGGEVENYVDLVEKNPEMSVNNLAMKISETEKEEEQK